jgi:Family of unknown function (DUF6152)
MNRAVAVSAAALAALACAGTVRAHHTGSMYETTPIWISGKVVSFERRNPHTITTLEYTSADGTVRRWAVEGPGESQLERLGLVAVAPQVGEVIEFCAHSYKAEWLSQFSTADADGTPRQLIEGHVMVKADGDRRLWDPHGVLSQCMRSSDDDRQSWLGFLRSDQQAIDAWCQQQAYGVIQSDAALMAYVEEIDRLLGQPCR